MIPVQILEAAEKMLSGPASISLMSGGINNEVYLCKKGSDSLVIKGYPSENGRERFNAELNFLNFCKKNAPSFVPRVLGQIKESNYIILECIEGERFLNEDKLKEDDMLSAFDFLKNINKSESTSSLGNASESFLKIEEYIDNVNRRINKLEVNHLPKEKQIEAKHVLTELRGKWVKTKDWVFCHPQFVTANCLSSKNRIVSPSDFGFHNAIKSDTGVKFIDFEFAGLDDPSKLLLDFFFQPRIAIHRSWIPYFPRLYRPENHYFFTMRTKILSRVLLVKWATISLGLLNPIKYNTYKALKQADVLVDTISNRIKTASIFLTMENPFELH